MVPVSGWPISAGGEDGADGGGAFDRLSDLPRAAHLLLLSLQVAPRHVERERVAEDVVEGRLDGDVGAAGAEHHRELDLVMHVLGMGRVGKLARGVEVVGVLLEEEGRLPVGVVAHLDRVSGVVPADAVDAADGKRLAAAHGQRGDRGRVDHVVGHGASSSGLALGPSATTGGDQSRPIRENVEQPALVR